MSDTQDRNDILDPDIHASSAEHDAWIKAEIEKTRLKKDAGKMEFTLLGDVMRKFGFR